MNSIIETPENSETDNVDGSKRKRNSITALNVLLDNTDDENSASEADDSEEYSEDEWNTNKKKKRKKKSNKSPVQTLKKKLAEKTKTLRKSIKQNRSVEVDKQPKVEKEKEADCNLLSVKNETDIKEEKTDVIKETKDVICLKIPKIEKTPPKIEKNVNEDVGKKSEPVVLTYATVKNSACMSPYLMVTTTSPNTSIPPLASSTSPSIVSTASSAFQLTTHSTVSTLTSDLTCSPGLQNAQTLFAAPFNHSQSPTLRTNPMVPAMQSNALQDQLTSFSVTIPGYSGSPLLNQTSTFSATPSVSQNFVPVQSSNPSPSSVSPSTNVGRLRIKSNLQTSPGVAQNLFNTSPSSRNVNSVTIPSPMTRVRNVPVQKTPIQSSPSPRSRIAFTNSGQNNSYRPRKLFGNGSPNSSTRQSLDSSISPRSVTTPRKNVPTVSRSANSSTPTLHNSIRSFKNISSQGTVIFNGSNSVTITPRKVVPERPPVQRTLFKNEIEGIIAARIENGVLRYVVNLANGTHLPLSNLQVTKLREQNNGALPTKLKIPVPSDVAAKIEPSFLIED